MIFKSRCLFSRIEVVALHLHPGVRAVDQDVPVAPAQAAVHAIRFKEVSCYLTA
jgi:hypothetical protein